MRFIKGFVFVIGLACFLAGAAGVVWVLQTQNVKGAAPDTIDMTKTVPAAGIKSLNVNADIGAVVVKPGSGSDIKARMTGRATEMQKDEWTLTAENGANGTWNVTAANGKPFHFGIDIGQLITSIASGRFPGMQLEITLPPQAYEKIVVHADNGRVRLDDIQADTIDASADNGAVELNAFKGKVLKLHTNNGAIVFKHVIASSSIVAETDNGRVEGSLDELASPVTMKADNGTVWLELPAGSPAQLDLSNDNGDVRLNASGDISYQTKEKHRINAKIGAATQRVKLSTDNGNVTVNVR